MNNNQEKYTLDEISEFKSLADAYDKKATHREKMAAMFAFITVATSIGLITKWDILPIAAQTAGLFLDSASSVLLIRNIRQMDYATAKQAESEALAQQLEYQIEMDRLASKEQDKVRRLK